MLGLVMNLMGVGTDAANMDLDAFKRLIKLPKSLNSVPRLISELGFREVYTLYCLSFKETRQRLPKGPRTNILSVSGVLLLMFVLLTIKPVLGIGKPEGIIVITLPLMMAAFMLMFYGAMANLNWDRVDYALHFLDSSWWKNTHKKPSEIMADIGVYGEYVATISMEKTLRKNKIYGKVLHNVIVPKRDGDFNEIDMVAVTDRGIFVVEVKARGGQFSGSLVGEEWEQRCGNNVHVMKNPVLQNINHINYLTEYIYEEMNDIIADDQPIIYKMFNLVLFTSANVDFRNVSKVPCPPATLVICAERYYKNNSLPGDKDIKKLNKVFTCHQVNEAARALKRIASYSADEIAEMMNRRAVMQQHNVYSHSYSYSIVEASNGTVWIMRDNGYYRTIMDTYDGLFRAVPEATSLTILERCNSLSDAAREYQKYCA